jgi:hypothetical protein
MDRAELEYQLTRLGLPPLMVPVGADQAWEEYLTRLLVALLGLLGEQDLRVSGYHQSYPGGECYLQGVDVSPEEIAEAVARMRGWRGEVWRYTPESPLPITERLSGGGE